MKQVINSRNPSKVAHKRVDLLKIAEYAKKLSELIRAALVKFDPMSVVKGKENTQVEKPKISRQKSTTKKPTAPTEAVA